MFAALGRLAVRRRWPIVVAALVVAVLGSALGGGAMALFTGGAGFVDPRSESNRADELLKDNFRHDGADVVVVYRSTDGRTVDDPGFARSVRDVVASLPSGTVAAGRTHWSTRSPDFVSTDRRATYVALTMAGATDEERADNYDEIKDRLETAPPGLTATVGGGLVFPQEINRLSLGDIVRAEVITMPILLVLLVLVFRSAIAACLPLAIGLLTMFGSLTVLRVVTAFADVSTYAFQIVTMLGLGLAIDYALFLVTRFREELDGGADVERAVARTMATAGRAVVFSGLTLAACFLGLLIFPQLIYRSIGYAGAAVVLFAVAATLTVLPALLAIAGRRVNSLRVPLPRPRRRAPAEAGGLWYRLAHAAMRRPVATVVAITALLVSLGLPFLGVRWGIPDPALLPDSAGSKTVARQLADDFGNDPGRTMTAAVTLPGDAASLRPQVLEYAGRLDQVAGVERVAVTGENGRVVRLTMRYEYAPTSDEAARMARGLRAVEPPRGAEALITGRPATLLDVREAIGDRMPLVALFVAAVCFVLLFWAFGSVLLPLKAIVFSVLSLGASFGAITLVFQHGWLSGVLGFTPAGWLDVVFPVIILVMAFGLALDYEVFLVSRIREEWDRTHDTLESVAAGAQRSSRVITSAAALLLVVVGGFALGQVVLMKMIGVGLVIAILVDATIVRGLLVPATMRLLGRWAWWAPGPLARWWERHGLRELSAPPSTAGPPGPAVPARPHDGTEPVESVR
ncbi:putative drug exporter of the RND superfamily [Thermomonospora echinospora]|uniref:Putative drug exporter of the RND superfamily n=1 Tax=Thermomonospora echinospora TaxID=1992 RepID=A0A1H5VDW9_9ACTN|nr:MMPL family transporter [Thermomonospora echinospora]SEF85246.1 putative drug exporter of the RND superfamily [Thermomonospora echinospora]